MNTIIIQYKAIVGTQEITEAVEVDFSDFEDQDPDETVQDLVCSHFRQSAKMEIVNHEEINEWLDMHYRINDPNSEALTPAQRNPQMEAGR